MRDSLFMNDAIKRGYASRDDMIKESTAAGCRVRCLQTAAP